jgi:putative ABC transport system substrate-binding protein
MVPTAPPARPDEYLNNRRAVIVALATLAVRRTAFAQPTRKVYRIGTLGVGGNPADMVGPQPRSPASKELLLGLRELGYVYGEHYVTEPRSPEGQVETLPRSCCRTGAPGTSTIPVVMAGAEDPVGPGVIKSLAHPGTNFTGLTNPSVELTARKLELLTVDVRGRTEPAGTGSPFFSGNQLATGVGSGTAPRRNPRMRSAQPSAMRRAR